MHPIGFKIADKRGEDGGTLIEYADKDPQIHKHYEGKEEERPGIGDAAALGV